MALVSCYCCCCCCCFLFSVGYHLHILSGSALSPALLEPTKGLVLCSINCTYDLPDSLGLGSEFPSPVLLSGFSLWHASKFKSEVGGEGGLETRLSKSVKNCFVNLPSIVASKYKDRDTLCDKSL